MELAGNWKWKQVDGTEIKNPLEPHYIVTCYASVAAVESDQFDVSIHIAKDLAQFTCFVSEVILYF